jgi:hypothetical protein
MKPVVMLTALTHNGHGLTRGVPMAWSPVPSRWSGVEETEPPVRVNVDGEEFDIRAVSDVPGQYYYDWISGPNPNYGFTSASSGGRPATADDHVASIRNFLEQVDPDTGYIE